MIRLLIRAVAALGVLAVLCPGCASDGGGKANPAQPEVEIRPYPLSVVTNLNGGEMRGPSW